MRPSVAIVLWILLGLAIFLADLFVPLGMATGVLYITLVFFTSWAPSPVLPFVAAALASVLVGLDWRFSPIVETGDLQYVLINRILSLLAIWATATLAALLIRSRRTERKATDALRRSEAKFRAAISHSPITVASCDAERRYTWICNPDPQFDAAAVIGKRDEELAPPEHVAALVDLKRSALERGERIRREIWITVGDTPRCYDVTAEPIVDVGGAAVDLVTAAFETTALRQAEAQLLAANRQKDHFLATLSHELRNPMAAIQNSLELLNQTDERSQRPLAILRRQSKIMTRLVNDLLSVAHLKHGKLALKLEVVDICLLAEEAAEVIRDQIESIGLKLVLELPAEPIYVDGDPDRITQIFDNLLRNALRHTKAGSITISACKEDDHARIAVRDTGMGIELPDLAAVFERHYQANPVNPFGSLGLGLTLVKGTVEKHGGTVNVHSDGLGRGSEFSFTIPLAQIVSQAASTPNRG